MTWTIRAPEYRPHGSQFVPNYPKGMCTLLAFAVCDIISKGTRALVMGNDPASVTNVQALTGRLYKEAFALGNCGQNGSMTQNQVIRQAHRDALPIDRANSLMFTGLDLPQQKVMDCLRVNVAHADRPCPLLIQVAAGHALFDAETGQEDEADLHTHAFAIYGTQTDYKVPAAGGYLCADGDNPGANAHPQIYSLATILAARPISILCFDYA